jgi:hypothetical protein
MASAYPSVRSGGSVELTLRIKNHTTQALRLDLVCPEWCSPFGVAAYDEDAYPADIERECSRGVRCGPRVLRVRIDRGGSATRKLVFSATVRRESEDCDPLPSRPMRRGKYALVAGLP